MCRDCCCDDGREAERELTLAEARGQFYQVTLRVVVEHTVDIPSTNYETADLEDFIGEVQENGEIISWEEV